VSDREESPGLSRGEYVKEPAKPSVPGDVPPGELADANLEAAITRQKEAIAAFEQQFVPLRRRYERLRGRLRDLEAERERRRLASAGQQAVFKPIPRRSITVAAVVAGRERVVPMDVPLSRFSFTSVRRQPIVLHPAGDREHQRLTFYRQPGPRTAEASTFGAAKRLLDEGWTPGVPGVALNRLAVYYPETATPGWLRLDQMYFEELDEPAAP
jgi:hypothetical protein